MLSMLTKKKRERSKNGKILKWVFDLSSFRSSCRSSSFAGIKCQNWLRREMLGMGVTSLVKWIKAIILDSSDMVCNAHNHHQIKRLPTGIG